jgi:hypothetical protein
MSSDVETIRLTSGKTVEIFKKLSEIRKTREDRIKLSRALRLGHTLCMLRNGVLSLNQAYSKVDGNLSPDDPTTYFNDRALLRKFIEDFNQYGTLDENVIELIENVINSEGEVK